MPYNTDDQRTFQGAMEGQGGGMPWLLGQQFKQYAPPAQAQLWQRSQGTPEWLKALATQRRQDVNTSARSAYGSGLAGLQQRGVLNSSLAGNMMAGVERGRAEGIGRVDLAAAQMGDDRELQALLALLSSLGGYPSQVMGYQQQEQARNDANSAAGWGAVGSLAGLLYPPAGLAMGAAGALGTPRGSWGSSAMGSLGAPRLTF